MPANQRIGQTVHTPELAEEICNKLSLGETLRAVCRDIGIHEATVRNWVVDDRHNFATQYARSRDIGLDCMADQLIDIADDSSMDDFDPTTGKINQESYQRARLKVDVRKWYLSKLAPKRYGDRMTNVHTGPEGGAIRFSAMSDSELNDRLTELQEIPLKSLPAPEKKE